MALLIACKVNIEVPTRHNLTLEAEIARGKIQPTVAAIRRHLRCSQARAMRYVEASLCGHDEGLSRTSIALVPDWNHVIRNPLKNSCRNVLIT
jgi:hypothetical protein